MIEFLDAPDDVIALTVSGSITADELSTTMGRLEQAFGRYEVVHVLVETHALHGIDIADLATYAKRARPLFRELRRFGRVAVVADQPWVRIATRIESAVLPGINYRVFEPAQRCEALAWVNDKLPAASTT